MFAQIAHKTIFPIFCHVLAWARFIDKRLPKGRIKTAPWTFVHKITRGILRTASAKLDLPFWGKMGAGPCQTTVPGRAAVYKKHTKPGRCFDILRKAIFWKYR